MKRCPTCGNTYTNDRLVFCLEDGATLRSISNAQSGFDPEATLHIPAEENVLPPTEASKPQGAPTLRQPSPPLTVPPRIAPATSDHQATAPSPPPPAAAAPPVAAATPPASHSTSPVVVAGITAIVVLLLVIAGLGIALLVRDSSTGNVATPNENNNRAQDRESNRNSSNSINDNGRVANRNASNRPASNEANRDNSTATDPEGRAEAKVVRGTPLEENDLPALARDQLRRLRNAVYARHGRTFDSADLQRYFDSRPWYKPRYDYNESSLTATDRANIKLIQATENSR